MKKLALIMLLAVPIAANAGPISITGYDIENTCTTGSGGWNHTYTGTITATGGSCTFSNGGVFLADYSGGTGTMADGLDSTFFGDTHLFAVADASVITVFLDGLYSINSIEFWQGDFNNGVPGGIESMDVTIGAITATILGNPFTTPGSIFANRNDLFSIGGSVLDGLVTDRIIFSNIFEGNCCGAFSISEIRLDGAAAAVPEPGTLALLGIGLAALGLIRRRRLV